jgi:glycerate kinase
MDSTIKPLESENPAMKVVLAPDSFSDFDSSPGIIARAAPLFAEHGIELHGVPMADGGEGTTLVLLNQLQAETSGHAVHGPLGAEVNVPVLSLTGGHFVEAARAVGRTLLEGPQPGWKGSSLGLGEVLSAMDLAHEEGPLIVGLGGSACFDGGLGLAQGLGLHALNKKGERLPLLSAADALLDVHEIVGDAPLEDRLVCGWIDVQSTLAEAPSLFGPDKGFETKDLPRLKEALDHWVKVVNRWRESQNIGAIDPEGPGTGAAGGLGFALRAFLDAPLLPGASTLGQRLGLRRAIRDCDVVITGEGRMDASSSEGKVLSCVIEMARACDKPVGVIAGSILGPMPLPPTGPDWIVACDQTGEEDWNKAFEAAVHQVAKRLKQR